MVPSEPLILINSCATMAMAYTEVTQEAGVLNYAWGLSVITTDLTNDGLLIFMWERLLEPDFEVNNGDGTLTESLANGVFKHIAGVIAWAPI